ncbi:bifunctional diaminohydroxyphosphoribosylaminopyrimidine deaminase/5-amino-6-(5-phosphoribosylamino)uracil reductase RibD [Brevibacterium litoralis]|uniref:bifunctional diaminohydroxyphosphoribosylaminopyrimidine deaminase/5-amino-6-(5-phosphoribosylamino)uracil reductase RibD n=1 Tax=Brevibacterium litoralis TaxID=3138935 RepID=UPI0032EF52F8
MSSDDERAVQAALTSAGAGPRGANPLVGAAVLAADGTLVTGHHRGAGTPHAEVDAIERATRAGIDLTTASLFVTLEPCNHSGHTGPCAQAVVDAGFARLVYAVEDPNPTASGGAARVRDAGIPVETVESATLVEAARELNARWFTAKESGRPFVTLKIAQSLDGRVAAADGTSRWITGPESRAHAHRVRTRVDGILVGTGTVLADDPRLTARDEAGEPLGSQPRPVVLGTRDLPADSHLARNPATLHLRTRDPREALRSCAEAGIDHLLVEGGPGISGALLAADLVDEVHLYTAPVLLGDGLPAVRDLGVDTLTTAPRFRRDHTGGANPEVLGADTLVRLVPAPAVHAAEAPSPSTLRPVPEGA